MSDIQVRPLPVNPNSIPYTPKFRQADAERIARKARLVADYLPQFATDPNMLLQLAQGPLDQNMLANQATQMMGLRKAEQEKAEIEQMSPGAQRAYYANLPPSRIQALSTLGYQPPTTEKETPGADLIRGIAAPLGAVYEAGYNVGSAAIGYGLNAMQELGEAPMEMYRQIRQQPEWIQAIALGAAVAATGGVALAGAGALGAGAAGLAGVLGGGVSTYGIAGLGGAYLAAGVTATMQGNPEYWADTFSLGREDGERDFTNGALQHAVDLLGDDGQILSLAKQFAFQGDPVETLLAEFGGVANADSDPVMMATAEKLVTEQLHLQPGTQEFQEAMQAMAEMTKAPQFRAAVAHLQSQKISMGRDITRLFGLDPDEGFGKIVSGGTDALSWFIFDPVLAAGKALRVNRAVRFGIRTDMEGEALQSMILRKAEQPAVKRSMEQITTHLRNDTPDLLYNLSPDAGRMWKPMKSWEAAERVAKPRADFVWDVDKMKEYLVSQEGMTALAAGRGPAWRHGMLELPHLGRVGKRMQNTRANLMEMARSWDSAGNAHRIPIDQAELAPEYFMGREVIPHTPGEPDYLWRGTNMVIDLIDDIPVIRNIVHPAAGLVTTMLTRIPSHGFIALGGPAATGAFVEEIDAFTKLSRVMGVDHHVAQQWMRAITTGGSIAERRQAVNYFYRMLFKATGVEDLSEGVELAQRFVKHADQSYVAAGDLGVFFGDSSSLLAIPNVRELRKAAMDHTWLNKVLNLADTPMMDAAVGRIWKPAVLLRIGFVTRAVGDELLSWLAREGPYGWVASAMGRSATSDSDIAGHVKWIDAAYQRMKRPQVYEAGYGRASFLKTGEFPELVSNLDDIHLGFLERYTEWLRRAEQRGLAPGLLQLNNPLSKWAGKENTIRGLILGGVPDEYLDAGRIWFKQASVQAAIMKEVSSGRSVAASAVQNLDSPEGVMVGADLHDMDYEQLVRIGGFEDVDPEAPGAAFDSYRRQMATWSTDHEVLEDVADVMSTYIDPKLAVALDEVDGEMAVRRAIALDRDEREFLAIMLLPEEGERYQALMQRMDAGSMLRRAYESAHGRMSERLPSMQRFLEEVGRGDLAQSIDDMVRIANGAPNAQGWAARAIVKGELGFTKRGWSMAELEADVKEAVRRRMADPQMAHKLSRMEYGQKGARSGVALAKPLPDEQLRMFAAYVPQQLWPHLAGLDANGIESFFRARNITLSDEAKKLIIEGVDMSRTVPMGAMTPNGGAVPLYGSVAFDPKVAREAGDAMARAVGLSDVPVYGEMAVPAKLGNRTEQTTYPWVINRTEHGYTIDPMAGPTPTDVSPRAGLIETKPANGITPVADPFAEDVTHLIDQLWPVRDELTQAEGRILDDLKEIYNGKTKGLRYRELSEEDLTASIDKIDSHLYWQTQKGQNEVATLLNDMAVKYARPAEYAPGLSFEQVLDEYSDLYAESIKKRFFARDSRKFSQDEAAVEFRTVEPAAAPEQQYVNGMDDDDIPMPRGQNGVATYKGKQVPVEEDSTAGLLEVDRGVIRYDQAAVEFDYHQGMHALFQNDEYAPVLDLLGITPEGLGTKIDAEGYADFLIGLQVRQLAGESVETALTGQARWADALPLPGVDYQIGDAPIRRFLWETNGPISMESQMVRDGRQLRLTKVGYDEKLQPVENIHDIRITDSRLAGRVANEDLPSSIQRPVLGVRAENMGAWDRTVRFGFRKVIGPMIDNLIREPLAFHNFARSYTDARRLSSWWLDRGLFGAADGFDEVVRADGSIRQIPRKEGRFLTASRNWAERDVRGGFLQLGDEERLAMKQTFERLGLMNRGDDLEQVLPNILRDREAVLEELRTFQNRPRTGIAAADQLADDADRIRAGVSASALRSLKAVSSEEEAQKFLVAWWRNIERHPNYAQARRDLHHADRNVQKKAARTLSDRLPKGAPGLTPTEIRTVAAASNDLQRIDDTVLQVAQERAIQDTIPFIDRDNVRSQGQEYMRNLVPFWFAEDQFMRRWARTAAYAPEMIRKAQLLYMGMRSGGVVKADANGNDYYVYPGTTLMAELVGSLPFIDDRLPIAEALTGQVKYSLPGLDRFGVPQVSPLIGIPLDLIANMFPEVREFQLAVQGDRAGMGGTLRAIVPTSFMRFYDAILTDDGDVKLASAMQTAAQVLEANGHGLPDGASADQIDHYMDRLRNHARGILLTQAMFGFVAPSSPQHQTVGDDGRLLPWYDVASLTGIDTPDALLTDEYIQLVRTMGTEAGVVEFLSRYPDTTPEDLVNRNIAYRVGKSQSVSGAPLPPLNPAMDFYDEHKTWMDQNPTAGAWLLPPAANQSDAEDRDINAYMEQQALGLRKRKTPVEFIRDLKFATASGPYFDTQELYQTKIDAITDPQERYVAEAAKGVWQASYLSSHPLFAEELQSGEGRARRALVLDSLRTAFNDPQTPEPWHAEGMRTLLTSFDQYRAVMAELSADSSKRGKEQRDALRKAFDDWGTQLTGSRPELASLWNGVIRIEARV